MYYDAHTHLNSPELFNDAEKYIQNFVDIGWKGMVVVWASEEYNKNAVALVKIRNQKAESDMILKITLGLHPEILMQDARLKNQDLRLKIQELKQLILDFGCNSAITPEWQNNVVAVGECGIDLYYPWSQETLDEQKELFAMQCDLAQELNLPLVIHSRSGFDQTLDVLKNYKNLTIYFHCRGYGPEEIKKLKAESIKQNWKLFIWFCGNVTYKKADELRESLKLVWEDQLLLETDAPYLSPQIVRWTQNEPANVKYIYDYVAEFLWKEKNILESQVEKNFKNLYKI